MLIIALVITQTSMGANNPSLKNEITDKLILDLSEVELDEYHQDFVVVSFQVCDGHIVVQDASGTQEELVQKVENKLNQLIILETYDEEMIYRYKFTFEKN